MAIQIIPHKQILGTYAWEEGFGFSDDVVTHLVAAILFPWTAMVMHLSLQTTVLPKV